MGPNPDRAPTRPGPLSKYSSSESKSANYHTRHSSEPIIMMDLSQKSFLDPQRATVKKTLSNSGPARPLRWGRNPSEQVHLCCFVGKPYLSSNLCWQSSEGSICVGKVSRYSLHPSTTKNVAQDVPRSSRLLPRCGGVAGLRLRWRWGEEMCYADNRKWCMQGVQPVLEGCELLWLRTEWR